MHDGGHQFTHGIRRLLTVETKSCKMLSKGINYAGTAAVREAPWCSNRLAAHADLIAYSRWASHSLSQNLQEHAAEKLTYMQLLTHFKRCLVDSQP